MKRAPFDITGLDSAEAALALVSDILEASTEYSIVGLDLDGRIVLWNAGARRLYGYEPEEVTGRGHEILYARRAVDAHQPEEVTRAALEHGKWEGMVERVGKGGRRFPARVRLSHKVSPRSSRECTRKSLCCSTNAAKSSRGGSSRSVSTARI